MKIEKQIEELRQATNEKLKIQADRIAEASAILNKLIELRDERELKKSMSKLGQHVSVDRFLGTITTE